MHMPMLQTVFGFTDIDQGLKPLHIVTAEGLADFKDRLSATEQAWIAANHFTAKPGQLCLLPAADGGISGAALGIGEAPIWDMAGAVKSLPAGNWQLQGGSDTEQAHMRLGWGLAQYKFQSADPNHHTAIADAPPAEQAQLYHPDLGSDHALTSLLMGTYFCRDLINLPANIMDPAGLENAARHIAQHFKADISVMTGSELETKAPAVHIVGRAAEVPPRLIDMKWGTTGPLITLVGKGITFDSGGLDLKPSKAMEMMKKDMGGAAHVLGLAAAIMHSQLPVRLRVMVAAAENAVSDRSMRPLDIIDTAAGIKVEVGNTDAEGRLVLADALHYARGENPDLLMDFATLTGAARVALGTECPALFANHDTTASALMQSGLATDDALWQLPLFAPYKRMLKTDHGALSSTGASGYGGAITAALFLQHFTGEDVNWVHIDVMAWNLGSRPGRPRGGEAMGLRAAYGLIADMAKSAS